LSFGAQIEVEGCRVLVCGGGATAMAPVRGLLDAGAHVTVAGPEIAATVDDLDRRGLITVVRRWPTAEDLSDTRLVVAASGRVDQDHQILALAREHGVLAASTGGGLDIAAATRPGSVTLVGGGPGDPGLLTVAGLEAIRGADVVVCDRLAPLALLDQAPPGALIIDVAKIPRGEFTPQERINELLVEHAAAGRTVVRFKGGDNFIFGRGGEEWQACAAAGIPVRVIPGVSSAVAAPALAGIPLTHRQLTQGFTVISGHAAPGDPASTLDYGALARTNTTLVIMMGVATLAAITDALVHEGLAADTPALTVADAGLPSQTAVRGTVLDIAARTHEAGIRPPAITVIGAVAGFSPTG
jgi:uroporphyrin-III C-methyltransferase